MDYKRLSQVNFSDYELLDSGNEKKLERFGKYVLARPDYQALWKPDLEQNEWDKADAILDENRNWKKSSNISEKWEMKWDNLKFYAKLTPFGHTGVFPEQSAHWKFIIEHSTDKPSVLSLFSYTGISTLAASLNSKVCHVDASQPAITWARENQTLSNLEQRSIRWILDDGLKFVKREQKRSVKYDGIIMDPPKFGRGPKGEVWKFEDDFPKLLSSCFEILSENPSFFIITAYTVSLSAISIGTVLEEMTKPFGGNVEYGDLGLNEQSGGRFLPQAIFARWSKE